MWYIYIYIYIFHSIDERYLENFIPINKPKQVKKKYLNIQKTISLTKWDLNSGIFYKNKTHNIHSLNTLMKLMRKMREIYLCCSLQHHILVKNSITCTNEPLAPSYRQQKDKAKNCNSLAVDNSFGNGSPLSKRTLGLTVATCFW